MEHAGVLMCQPPVPGFVLLADHLDHPEMLQPQRVAAIGLAAADAAHVQDAAAFG